MSLATSNGDFDLLADAIELSDDEPSSASHARHETIETVPIRRLAADDDSDDEHETLPTQMLQRQNGNANTSRLTQPTQIIRPSPAPPTPSSPSLPQVQVAASSPTPTAVPIRRPQPSVANVMAPAGTAFRRPFAPPPQPRPKPILIDSDDEGPKYRGGSSDDEREEMRKNDIKTTTFQRRKPESDSIPESPARGNGLFTSVLSRYYHDPSNGVKRSADTNAFSYGNSSKRPRQTGPSRAVPLSSKPEEEEDMALEDIPDYNVRQKVRRMQNVLPSYSIRECYRALEAKKGNYDDACDYLVSMSEKKDKQANTSIDLTGSDDELMPTPAGPKKVQPAKQQAKVPVQSIRDKWGGSTQQARPLAPASKKLDVFDTPLKQGRRLVRGRRDPSPDVQEQPSTHIGRKVQELSDDETEDDSGIHSAPENATAGDRLLKFFNECTTADLADTAVIDHKLAEHILSKRPFNTTRAIDRVQAPDLKTAKSKRKAPPIGERVAEKVADMLTSYDAVDFLVKKCEALSKPLTAEMKSWGVKIDNSENGELDLVELAHSHRSTHDSGIGTPVSDDEKSKPPKSFIGQPVTMNGAFKLKDYQIVGMNWLNLLYRKRLSCILADDMGLGKTYQVIAFLSHLREVGVNGPHLIVVPAATLENWLKEFHQFSPKLRVVPYYSTIPGERARMRDEIDYDRDDINVVVTTYTLAKGKDDHPWLKDFGFKCTVFDEGHYLKNADSQVSKRLVRIKSSFRLLLTGTPLQNNLKELISLLGFMMPDLFKEKYDDLQAIFTHKIKAMDDNHKALLSDQRIARARSMLTPFILRRKKYQVLKDLPKKDRRVEYCDLTPEQAEIYQKWLKQALEIREQRERDEEVSNETTHILMKLRQAALHPFLSRRLYKDEILPKIAKQCLKDDMWRDSNPDLIVTELTHYSDMEIHTLCDNHPVLEKFALNDHEWLASGKVQKMLELLRTFMAEGHRTLIFSQFVMILDVLELVLEREAISYFRLDGSTRVSERQDLIDEFSTEDNDTPVFMLSTKAGGAGINLAKANKVIVFDSGFNPQDDIQAENRAHRIGQIKEVEVIRLITKGTVEEQIYAMGETKLKLDERVAGVGINQEEENDTSRANQRVEEETKQEAEGRKAVEDMFFSKLKAEPEKVKEEAASPVQMKKELPSSQASPSKKAIQGSKRNSPRKANSQSSSKTTTSQPSSQKTIKPEEDNESQKTLTEKTQGVTMKDELDHDWVEVDQLDGVSDVGVTRRRESAAGEYPTRPKRSGAPAAPAKKGKGRKG